MEINDMIRLMQAVKEHDLTSFRLEEGDLKLSIKKEKEIVTVTGAPFLTAAPETMGVCQPGGKIPDNSYGMTEGTMDGEISSDKVVASPLVGTFYNAGSPEADPFIKAGDLVKKGQVLGIIEAMKLMNEIECEYDGVVEAVLVGNEDVVEYGQPLFRIR
ncbi:acetyl-CoA carboxylase biotin carboxyl carrier protein [Lacrimispora algidixylanolytica]|uniref:Biotin carboxyl carrier protein of acetyl-CoA carboxylase n=1 Tax=Lacrimispora algidixylanolytica TaxID=94868 RepID=A0A419T634_9FIRM|nr:acetyl-CoA carboxylase biotin carboxyl carrier protein [Lacrimispora algidixylanolytica]RKD32886.1 acetyl-CoA carboxylase, biotin carboxyl carrier protein [Lacrimispora algidixylanolytica]